MGQYSNEPITDARLKKSHDNFVTNEDDWQRFIHHEEEDEELKEEE